LEILKMSSGADTTAVRNVKQCFGADTALGSNLGCDALTAIKQQYQSDWLMFLVQLDIHAIYFLVLEQTMQENDLGIDIIA
jgi:hypothetical protein